MKRRIGILTSGRDCPGLNACIRGVARASYSMFDAEIIGIQDGYAGLIAGDYKEMKQSDFSGILTLGGTILGTRRTPFRNMRVVSEDGVDKVKAMKANYKKMKLDCLVTLGGNGTHKTANLLRKERHLARVILVEGYMDVVSLSQFGVEGVAATLGTALTPEQAKLLSRYAPEVWLSYDGDSAGQHAILRGLDILEETGVPVKVLDFPGGLDPDEFIRQEGLEAFEALKPISGVYYRMLREKEKHDMSAEEGRTEYAKACAGFLRKVREPVELENYVKRLSMETGFDREVLLEQIGVRPAAPEKVDVPKRESFRQKAKEVSQVDWAARTLLAVLSTGRLPEGSVSPDDFDDPAYRSLCEALLGGESPAALMERQPDDEGRAVIGDILSINTDLEDEGLMQMAQDCLKKLRRERLEKEMDKLQKSLSGLTDEQRAAATQRALQLAQQLTELK